MGKLLISKGANINAKTIIHQYMVNSSFLIILKQIKETNLNKNNKTPLYYARHFSNQHKLEQLLLSNGAHE